MKQIVLACTVFLCLFLGQIHSQNLPSLLTGKDINSTFSIVGYDAETQEWGIAVATHNLYVGNSTIYIEPGVGAFSVIAETNPDYGINGIRQLQEGASIEQAILFTKEHDGEAHYRQVSGLDSQGKGFAFTGEALKYWKGKSTHLVKEGHVVMGNQLGEGVLERMSEAYENASGTLAERLLAALVEGQLAGGQISGKQSAALVVKGMNNDWYNQIDLRVDHSSQPFQELQKLLDYHYGRIQLNQSFFALQAGNRKRAETKLSRAEQMLAGWNGMYSKIALVHSLMGRDEKAISWVKQALLENPNWKVNLPAFYYLHTYEEFAFLIDPESFSIKDWEAAISMYSRLGRETEAVALGKKLLGSGKKSSYLHYLLGRSYANIDDTSSAISELQKALELDVKNVEARLLLEQLKD